jgi:hypothetical protein
MKQQFWFAVSIVMTLCCGRSALYDYRFEAGLPGTEPTTCVPGELTPKRVVPAAVLVIDKSGSMADTLDGKPSSPRRWNALQQSLRDTLLSFDNELRLGLVFFPRDARCGAPGSIELAPQLGQGTAILRRFAQERPLGGTPTFTVLESMGAQLSSLKTKVLILMTDGVPNCNLSLDVRNCECMTSPCLNAEFCSDRARTVMKLATLRQEDILTYVVGIGTGTNVATLDAMALAGGVPRLNASQKFYSGASARELSEALTDIGSRLRSCSFTTNSVLKSTDVASVTVGGEPVVFGNEGWTWIDMARGELRLSGPWCDKAIAGATVRMRLECTP